VLRVLSALVLAALFRAASAELAPLWTEPDDDQLRMLEVHLGNQVMDDVLLAYEEDGMMLLPLGSLASMLGLAITTDPAAGTATGFILQPERRFELDGERHEVTLSGKRKLFDQRQLRVYPDDLYLDAALLAQWLPMQFDIDLFALRMTVKPREALPLQQKQIRETRIQHHAALRARQDPGYPYQDTPYQAWDWPFIDLQLGAGLRRQQNRSESLHDLRLHASTDLIGLEARLYLAATTADENNEERWQLGRSDADGRLLGRLSATRFTLGHVSDPGLPLISADRRPRRGLLLTNQPLFRPDHYDQHSFRGELPDGWDVELYHNNALTSYQTSNGDGQYHFDDIPLLYGNNSFRLVFYGPHGEQREEHYRFVLSDTMARPGEQRYQLLLQQSDGDLPDARLDYSFNLSKQLAARLALGAATVDGKMLGYQSVGLQGFAPSLFGRIDLATNDIRGGTAIAISLRGQTGPLNIGIGHSRFERGFISPLSRSSKDPLLQSSVIRLDSRLTTDGLPTIPLSVNLTHNRYLSGRENRSVENRLSLQHARALFTHSLFMDQGNTQSTSVHGQALLSFNGVSANLHGRAGYSLRPNKQLHNISVSVNSRQLEPYWLDLTIEHHFDSDRDQLAMTLSRQWKQFDLGLSLTADNQNDFSVLLHIRSSTAFDPRSGKRQQLRAPLATRGSLSARVFLDHDQNGRFDPTDEPLENVSFRLGRGGLPSAAHTNSKGTALLTGLTAYRPLDITLDSASLDDPAWLPATPGWRILPRPGQTTMLQFPIVMTGEIDGTVYLQKGEHQRPAAGVKLQLLDNKKRIIQHTETAFDGFYLFSGVPLGDYHVQIEAAQLDKLGLATDSVHQVHLDNEQPVISGQDFMLVKPLDPSDPQTP